MKNILKNIKRTYITIASYVTPVFAMAANSTKITSPSKFTDLSQVVTAVVDVVQVLLIMATVLYLLYAGLMFVTARGDANKISQARDALLWGMVGAALIIGARVLVAAIQSGVGNILK